ncbi:SET domain-containing protein [Xylaria sp. CBS 124048]|nr:SET domain-containing protein [Xylaria sp. CBS 124048]
MDPLEELVDWATSQGVKLNGIIPSRIPGRGVGVIAARDIQADEIVLEVPTTSLRTLSTVPKSRLRKLSGDAVSIHGLLAADLALDKSSKYAPWSAICPRPEDLVTMPLLWPSELQALLPLRARELLEKQAAKSSRDCELVVAVFPELGGVDVDVDAEKNGEGSRAYRHAWLLVNSRTFYYVDAVLKRRRGLRRDDCLALMPVADLFNHADEGGCHVAFDADGFAFRATAPCREGDEVRICYGRHGGDFLLVEYGFVMEGNRWDEVLLDEVLLERLDESAKERLETAGFLGGYVLDSETVCHRTEVALRLLCCRLGEWMRFVDGSDGGEKSRAAVDALLLDLLKEYRDRVGSNIEKIQALQVGEKAQRDILMERWAQIGRLLDTRIGSLIAQRT